ncbi:MAG: anti-sigma factor family protein, partial [Gemmataceae bacterium]
MSKGPPPVPLTARERADLVAYLDGELSGEAAESMEAKLNLDPRMRAEAESLKKAWDLLDFLP